MRHTAGRRTTIRWIFQFTLLGAALGSLPGTFSGSTSLSILFGALLGAACGSVVTLVLIPWLQGRAQRQSRTLIGSFEAQLDRKGLDIRSQDGREMTRSWKDLGRISPDQDHLFLYWKDGQATVLPRRALPAEAGEAELRTLIYGKAGKSQSPAKRLTNRSEGPSIELQVARTPDDLARFAWHQNLHDPALRVRAWFSYAVATGMTIYLAASVFPWWGAVVAGLLVSAALPRLYYGLLKQKGASMLQQAGHREVVVRLDAAGVTETAAGSSAKIRWSDVARIEETPDLILIYIDRLQALVLPRRSLGGDAPDRLEQIRQWHASEGLRQAGTKAKQ